MQGRLHRLILLRLIFTSLVATGVAPQEAEKRPGQSEASESIELLAGGHDPRVCMAVWHWKGDMGSLCFTRDRVRYDVKMPPESVNLGFDHLRSDLMGVEKRLWGAEFKFRDGRNWHFVRVPASKVRHGTLGEVPKSERLEPALLFEAANHFDELVSRLEKQTLPKLGQLPASISRPTPAVAENRTMTVLTQLAKVRVYVDDQFKGATGQEGRLVINHVSIGMHHLRLESNGHNILTRDFSLAEGETSTIDVRADLGPKPLTQAEIDDLFANGVPKVRIIALITQYGVDFVMTEELERQLRAVGADDATLLAITKAKK